MFTKTFVQHVVLCAPTAKGAVIRVQTCCLYVLLTCSRVFSRVSHFCTRKTNRWLVPSFRGRTHRRKHNKQVQSTALFGRHAWVTSPGQIWCVCHDMYYITEIYGKGWQPECLVNFNFMFLRKITLYWAAVLWERSPLRPHSSLNSMHSGQVCFQNFCRYILSKMNLCSHRKKLCYFKSNISGSLCRLGRILCSSCADYCALVEREELQTHRLQKTL